MHDNILKVLECLQILADNSAHQNCPAVLQAVLDILYWQKLHKLDFADPFLRLSGVSQIIFDFV